MATHAPAALMDACMGARRATTREFPGPLHACDPGFANGVTKFVCSECKVTPSPKPLNEIYPS